MQTRLGTRTIRLQKKHWHVLHQSADDELVTLVAYVGLTVADWSLQDQPVKTPIMVSWRVPK